MTGTAPTGLMLRTPGSSHLGALAIVFAALSLLGVTGAEWIHVRPGLPSTTLAGGAVIA
ncbi:hypothetical protein [Dactylosporangium sp. NPDC051541]|uniref:hypothetical protein n=1 Tax=Dactylosporangium sp. NPDC051541 TaxID=3363977 RepID=UPI003795FFFE